MQHLFNYLAYDYRGPSGYIVNFFYDLGLEEVFTRFILWYVIQILVTLICIKLFIKRPLKEVGFNLYNHKSGLRYILVFIVAYPMIVSISWLLIYQFVGASAVIGRALNQPVDYMIKDLLVYGLLPGLGEEPLFRVFVIQFLLIKAFKEKDLDYMSTRLWIIIISAICFAYGHIYID